MNEDKTNGARESETLCLTLNRSSQRLDPIELKERKQRLKDKQFTMLKKPPYFCNKKGVVLLTYKNRAFDSAKFLKMLCNSWRCPR